MGLPLSILLHLTRTWNLTPCLLGGWPNGIASRDTQAVSQPFLFGLLSHKSFFLNPNNSIVYSVGNLEIFQAHA